MKSTVLRRIVEELQSDPSGARVRLRDYLELAKGPLIERVDAGRALVTFVLMERSSQPAVRCALFPGLDPSVPMHRLPGTHDVWYAETEADDNISVLYQYQTEPVAIPAEAGALLTDPQAMAAYVEELDRVGFADPINPASHLHEDATAETPADSLWESELTMPDAALFPWHAEVANPGMISSHTVESAAFGNSRMVTVWCPAGVSANGLPVLVLLDGEYGLDTRFRADRIFANLISGGHTQPFVALLVHNADEWSRITEYACHPAFPTLIADDVLPQLRAEIGFSSAPERVAIGGFSLGGLASLWTGLSRPDAVGNVVSMSASAWWGGMGWQSDDNADTAPDEAGALVRPGADGRPEWLIRHVDAIDRRPIRIWLDVGLLEAEPVPLADGLTQLTTNRHLRDALLRRGYDVVGYVEQPGGHDPLNWRRTLPQALSTLFPVPGRPA